MVNCDRCVVLMKVNFYLVQFKGTEIIIFEVSVFSVIVSSSLIGMISKIYFSSPLCEM